MGYIFLWSSWSTPVTYPSTHSKASTGLFFALCYFRLLHLRTVSLHLEFTRIHLCLKIDNFRHWNLPSSTCLFACRQGGRKGENKMRVNISLYTVFPCTHPVACRVHLCVLILEYKGESCAHPRAHRVYTLCSSCSTLGLIPVLILEHTGYISLSIAWSTHLWNFFVLTLVMCRSGRSSCRNGPAQIGLNQSHPWILPCSAVASVIWTCP